MSGGVDSAVVLSLARSALGAKNVVALHLPYSSGSSGAQDLRDAALVSGRLGVRLKVVKIRKAANALARAAGARSRLELGNVMARARMAVLYSFARRADALVLGTGNRTELLLGYFTKFGDGGCDLLPIGSLYKTQVWQLAMELGVPERIVAKPPSAGLWDEQTDEAEMGFSYAQADRILVCLADLGMPASRVGSMYGSRAVSRVLARMESARHKLRTPPVLSY